MRLRSRFHFQDLFFCYLVPGDSLPTSKPGNGPGNEVAFPGFGDARVFSPHPSPTPTKIGEDRGSVASCADALSSSCKLLRYAGALSTSRKSLRDELRTSAQEASGSKAGGMHCLD